MVGSLGLCGCSPGQTDLTHPGSPRDLSNAPDTVNGTWSEDRIFRPKLQTGNFVSLLLTREEGVISDLYFRFDLEAFDDTAAFVGAELDLTLFEGTPAGVRLEAFLIEVGAKGWVEDEIPTEGLAVAAEPFYVGSSPIAPNPDGNPLTVISAVTVPRDILHGWMTGDNHGFAVRVAPSNLGYISVASSEAVVDTTDATVSTAGLRLLAAEGQGPGTLEAEDDAYRLFDSRPIDGPSETSLFVEQQIPHRGLIRVDLAGVDIPAGSTVHRAELELGIVPGSIAPEDTFVVAVYRNTSDWAVEVEPDSVIVSPVPTDFKTVNSNTETVSFDFGDTMQQWVDGGSNFGLTVRTLSEGSDTNSLRFFSVEADSSAPGYRVEFVPPPPPRWEDVRP